MALCEAVERFFGRCQPETHPLCGCIVCQARALRAAIVAEPALDRETLARVLSERYAARPGEYGFRAPERLRRPRWDFGPAAHDEWVADADFVRARLTRGAAEPSDAGETSEADVARELAERHNVDELTARFFVRAVNAARERARRVR